MPLYDVTRPNIEGVETVELTDEDLTLVRPPMPTLTLEERFVDYAEVELGLPREEAIKEARRCLRCDLED